MLKIVVVLLMAIAVVGCGPRYVDYFPYHDDGRAKPFVALVPLVDNSDSGLPWDVAQELTEDLRYRLMDDAELYLLAPGKVAVAMQKVGDCDYFGKEIAFSKEFCNCEFVTIMELIEHSLVPYIKGTITPLYTTRNHQCDSVLMMKVRIRVIDLRKDKPSVILQEIVDSNHMIPWEGNRFDYAREPWGSGRYSLSPYGIAHQRLACDLAKRLEAVTRTAR